MHLCQRFFQSSKPFSNSIFGIAFNSFSDALLMSSMAVERRPFKVLFFLEIGKSHTELCLANMETGASLQYCFWPKIHEQAMKCEQVHYRGAKAMNCFSTNFMASANRYANIISDFSDCDSAIVHNHFFHFFHVFISC